ncbi:MAG: carbon-nitrogen hydrolase family protein [Clostridiales bacterium]|nr:carbon-nitrogen hydrolase family protein [Clostridiales bacterium]MCF8022025.1 carbon-nitrogen hydrolase family protein [Clostridiales bacterium]
MHSFLNLAIIQMPLSPKVKENIQYLEQKIDKLFIDRRRPDLIVGVEFGIAPRSPEPAGGEIINKLASIASKYNIYFIPGTMKLDDGKGGFYNAAPIFNPRGKLIDTYAKMVPWDSQLEEGTIPGEKYSVFEIPEKDTRVGVQICFDADFPEISRTQTLLGAEILIQLSMDPDSIPLYYNTVKNARAIENQAYYVYTNGVGDYDNMHLRGHSSVFSPEGKTLYEAGENPTSPIITLNLDEVRTCRKHGSWHQVRTLKNLYKYRPKQPYAGCEEESPLFKQYFRTE